MLDYQILCNSSSGLNKIVVAVTVMIVVTRTSVPLTDRSFEEFIPTFVPGGMFLHSEGEPKFAVIW